MPSVVAPTIDARIAETMIEIRRDLHRHPELSWKEGRTTSRICHHLDRLGIDYERPLDTGVVADLPGPAGVPKVALRADIDALPIEEETGLPFASTVPGVMHACGHDGHTGMLLGAAEALLARDRPAPVRLIFQPAEEVGAGAQELVRAGVLEGVGLIFGAHLDRRYRPGTLVVTDGPVNACTDAFRIEIAGRGGHAARPHETVDAVVVGSLMVTAIQTIVSREVDPAHPAVVSVGRFTAGTVGNAIAGTATLEGSIRTLDPEVREQFSQAVERIAKAVGDLHGAEVKVDIRTGTPSLTNPPGATALAREAARRVVGEENVTQLNLANMGGEDFSHYLNRIPGCYIRIGGRIDGRRNHPAHSSRFDFDEQALAYGARWMAEVALVGGRSLS